MNTFSRLLKRSTLIAATLLTAVIPSTNADLKDAFPDDVFLAVYGMQNPEREYQKQHYAKVWETIESTDIVGRFAKAVQNQMSGGDVEEMLKVRDTLEAAIAPIQWDALADMQEIAFGMRMQGPLNQQFVLVQFDAAAGQSLFDGISNLMQLAAEKSNGRVPAVAGETNGMKILTLQLPNGAPMSPSIGIRDGLFLFTTNSEMASEVLGLLDDPSQISKFDDPRVTTALASLPKAEDALVFFDGNALQEQLQGVLAFAQAMTQNDENAQKGIDLLQRTIAQTHIAEFEVTVGYTEGYRNLTATYGKSTPDADSLVFGRIFGGKELFSDWASWIPKEANGFSLGGGASLHPLYEWIETELPKSFPESQQAFDRLAAMEQQFDVKIDDDILSNINGEFASISTPGPQGPFGKSNNSVAMMKCNNAPRLQELIGRAMDAVAEIPQAKQQGFKVVDSQDIRGYKELSINMLAMLGGAIKPTYGVSDGWFTFGSSPSAIQQVMMVRNGEAANFTQSEAFAKFETEVTGDIYSISFANTGQSIRDAAAQMQQMGTMIPMMMAMAGGGQGGGPDLTAAQDFLQLLPSVGRIIGTFDFLDATMMYSKPGPEAGTYLRHTITKIVPPKSDI